MQIFVLTMMLFCDQFYCGFLLMPLSFPALYRAKLLEFTNLFDLIAIEVKSGWRTISRHEFSFVTVNILLVRFGCMIICYKISVASFASTALSSPNIRLAMKSASPNWMPGYCKQFVCDPGHQPCSFLIQAKSNPRIFSKRLS